MLKVISGGQTGADAIGLMIARDLGFPTGGTAPHGYRTEIGPNLYLRDTFGLREHPSTRYEPRTLDNVREADLTVIFGDVASNGTALTIGYCRQLDKPYLCNPTGAALYANLKVLDVRVLNIAGNRGSKFSEARRLVMRECLTHALNLLKTSKSVEIYG